MLLLRVLRTMHWSFDPTACEVKTFPVGSVARFWKTFPPDNLKTGMCDYHKHDTSQCRHIALRKVGGKEEVRTNVCMEEARLYFVISEQDERLKKP